MARLLYLLPGVLVAVILTVITALFLNGRSEIDNLTAINNELKSKLEISQKQLAQKSAALNELERTSLIRSHAERQIPVFTAQPEVKLPPQNSSLSVPQQNSINAKVNSIGKFVPLNEDQRERLQKKFSEELDPTNRETETLEEIIGAESASFYREQRKKAFERVLKESIEKEILFIARKLLLDAQQEDALRNAYLEVESVMNSNRQTPSPGNTQSTLERLVLEEKERDRMLQDKLKSILTPSQFEQYMEYQSGSQDMQLWHEK